MLVGERSFYPQCMDKHAVSKTFLYMFHVEHLSISGHWEHPVTASRQDEVALGEPIDLVGPDIDPNPTP